MRGAAADGQVFHITRDYALTDDAKRLTKLIFLTLRTPLSVHDNLRGGLHHVTDVCHELVDRG